MKPNQEISKEQKEKEQHRLLGHGICAAAFLHNSWFVCETTNEVWVAVLGTAFMGVCSFLGYVVIEKWYRS